MFNRIFWGIVLIIVGVLFILDQRDMIEFDLVQLIVTYWPLILIYFGLKGLIFQYKWGQGVGFGYLWPLILTIFGVYFLGHNIDYIHMSAGDFFQYIIPFLLIVIGVLIVLKPGRRNRDYEANTRHDADAFESKQDHDIGAEEVSEDRETSFSADDSFDNSYRDSADLTDSTELVVSEKEEKEWRENSGDANEQTENHFSFIGDIHIGSANWRLKPLNVNHLIGDTVIDLTRASIPEGLTKINVGCILGDVQILLPKDVDVQPSVTMTSVMGEFNMFGKRDDKMFKNLREEPPEYLQATKKIQIMANVLIGDLRIERV